MANSVEGLPPASGLHAIARGYSTAFLGEVYDRMVAVDRQYRMLYGRAPSRQAWQQMLVDSGLAPPDAADLADAVWRFAEDNHGPFALDRAQFSALAIYTFSVPAVLGPVPPGPGPWDNPSPAGPGAPASLAPPFPLPPPTAPARITMTPTGPLPITPGVPPAQFPPTTMVAGPVAAAAGTPPRIPANPPTSAYLSSGSPTALVAAAAPSALVAAAALGGLYLLRRR
jgi:hypothetical protein